MFELTNKVAIVTGATSGIGKAVARAYIKMGAKVALVARDTTKLVETEKAFGDAAFAVSCDVTNEASVASMVALVLKKWGRIDVAVCNAGIVTLAKLCDMPVEEFESVQKTNVTGVFLVARTCAKEMKSGGSIIVTASMSGHVVNTPQDIGHYCASKGAVLMLTKALAVELAPRNIRVNSISPGYIMTELVEPLTDYHAIWKPRIPLGRLGKPDELTGLFIYLASDASGYMTGSDLIIDGGYTAV
jgi:sorbose reductase